MDKKDRSSSDESYARPDEFDSQQVKPVKQFNVRHTSDTSTPYITGVTFLPDSRVLLADFYNDAVKLFDAHFNFIDEKKIVHCWDVSASSSSDVAVTSQKRVVLLSVSNGIEDKGGSISVGFTCYGVSFASESTFLVSGTDPDGIALFNTDGTELFRILNGKGNNPVLSKPWYIISDRTRARVYVASSGSPNVSAFDINTKKLIFTYDNLRGPKGMVTDKEGNLYVCDQAKSNVLQLSPSGQLNSVILTYEDDLELPQCLAILQFNELLVSECRKSYTKVYQLKNVRSES